MLQTVTISILLFTSMLTHKNVSVAMLESSLKRLFYPHYLIIMLLKRINKKDRLFILILKVRFDLLLRYPLIQYALKVDYVALI